MVSYENVLVFRRSHLDSPLSRGQTIHSSFHWEETKEEEVTWEAAGRRLAKINAGNSESLIWTSNMT